MTSSRERFLEALLESATDYAIITLDLDGLVTSWNAGARHVLGWDEAEMLGKPASNFFTIEDRRRGVPQVEMQQALTKGRGSDERWHLRKDGSRFWANGEMMPLKDENGEVQGFIKILRDRTQERLAAEAQRADAEFLRSVLASSGDCIKVLDLTGSVTYMNEGGLQVMEVSDFNAIKGCPWPSFWTGDGHAAANAALESAKAGQTAQFHAAADTMAGTPKWWDVLVTPILGGDGRPEKILAVSRDITDRKRAEVQLAERVTELHASEARFRDLNETLEQRVEERTRERDRIWLASHDMLGVSDGNGIWRAINPAWQKTLGWAPEDILGKSSAWLEHPDDAMVPRSEPDAAGDIAFENRLRTINGEHRVLSWTGVAVGGMIYWVARDVTDQRAQQEALAKTEEALRQSQKMEALGQLTGGIAHDFNNLLTGIIGSLDILRRRITENRLDDVNRFMDAASSSAHRAASLTHRLLAFARRQSLDTKPSDVNRLVAGMEELLLRSLGEQVKLQTDLAEGLWPALADQNQLENAILNLAINARDAMTDGGRLTIETANTTLDQAYALANDDVVAGDYVMICVSDTGSGMPANVLAKAFDPFFTTKPIGEGTGLGLSMIYGFVKQSAGHVRIYSEVGQGTSIKLYLRRAPAELAAIENTESEVPLGRGETVLVVEDEESVRLIITDVLEELGYRHLEARDGQSALPILQSAQRVDLLITDVGLPNMNGRQLAEIARAARPALKVLFVTGYAEKAAVRHGFLEPGMEMLSKPFALDALATKVRDMLEKPATQDI